jgi:MoaA/NifB/PqqE/SkfB family radical SAM enzyme
LIEDAHREGASQISFGGGEPTSCDLFFSALMLTQSLGMRSEVFTCGVGFSDRDQPCPLSVALIEKMAAVPNLRLIFSFHGADELTHDSITTVAGSFSYTRSSLEACLAAGLACEANFVPLKPNARALEPLALLLARKGVSKLSILRFVPQGRGLSNAGELLLSREEETRFLDELVQLRSRRILEIRTGSPFNGVVPGSLVPCRAGTGKLVVQPDGNIIPCEVFKQQERRSWGLNIYRHRLGDVTKSTALCTLRHSLDELGNLTCPIHGDCGSLPLESMTDGLSRREVRV